MNKPVYLFTGFLESGKTTLIQDTLRDPGFTENEKTLLLVCEDGEVEYDEVVMQEYQTTLCYIEDESKLSADFLLECEKKYQPDRILIEFNGTWNVNALLNTEFPINWILVQILSTVDAATFGVYMNNMRSIMYDQLSASEVIIFNRCSDKTKKSYLRSNIKAMNKKAQLIYENIDGTINDIKDDELPFDCTKDHIELQDDDYGLWYMDALEHPYKYKGKTISYKGKVISADSQGSGDFVIGRYAMVCCEDDTSLIGLIAHNQTNVLCAAESWVKIHAELGVEYDEDYEGEVPVLLVDSIEKVEPIENDLVYFS